MMTISSVGWPCPSSLVPRWVKTSTYTSYNDTVVVGDYEWKDCRTRFGLLLNTPGSGKIASMCPLALVSHVAYTQDAKSRLTFQVIPPFPPVNVTVPIKHIYSSFVNTVMLTHLSFSKSTVMHEACLLLFLHRYNGERAILLR
jgi:hypothetical protein